MTELEILKEVMDKLGSLSHRLKKLEEKHEEWILHCVKTQLDTIECLVRGCDEATDKLAEKHEALVNAAAKTSMQLRMLESSCREFEKQRINPLEERIKKLEYNNQENFSPKYWGNCE